MLHRFDPFLQRFEMLHRFDPFLQRFLERLQCVNRHHLQILKYIFKKM